MATQRFKSLRRNKFFLFWCKFFLELNALNAVLQLFYQQRGLNISQIFYIAIAWSITTLIFEIPTGYLADKWGRKNLIILGVILNLIASFLMFFSFGFLAFIVITILLSLAASCFSGTEDALLYDTLKEMKQENVVLKTSGKYLSAARLSKVLTPLIGAFLVKDLLPEQFTILLLINFISSIVAIIFAFLLIEPNRKMGLFEMEVNVFQDGLKKFINEKTLSKIVFNKTLIFVASFIFWKFYQGYLYDIGISVIMLGFLYPIFNSIYILTYLLAERLSKKIPLTIIFNFVPWMMLVGSLIFIFVNNMWVAYSVSVFLLIGGMILDPFYFQQIQWRLKSYNRATTTSILNIFKSILDIPILFLSGYLAMSGVVSVNVIMILITLIVLIFFRIKKIDLLMSYNDK